MTIVYVIVGILIGAVLLTFLSKGRKDEEDLSKDEEEPSTVAGCLFAIIQISILGAFGWLVLKFFEWFFS